MESKLGLYVAPSAECRPLKYRQLLNMSFYTDEAADPTQRESYEKQNDWIMN